MPEARPPVDALTDELVGVYGRAGAQLEALVRDGLTRGLDPRRAWTENALHGDATVAYRARQLIRARAILKDLDLQVRSSMPRLTAVAYRSSLFATDITLGDALTGRGGFAATHQRVIEVLAENSTNAMRAALERTGSSVDFVFERANALDGGLPVNRAGEARRFIGRRVDDPWRAKTLDELAQGKVTLATRKQISASLSRRLVNDGVTDALTGFVDRAGRRWPLHVYTEMAARTTMREASSRALTNRLSEGDAGIITISSHPHQSDECSPYDGETFAIRVEDAERDGLAMLDEYPPFHPRCRHVATPGTGNLDAYQDELEGSIARYQRDDEESYEVWAEKESRRAQRARSSGGLKLRCHNCNRFVTGKFATCKVCGYDHGAASSFPAGEEGGSAMSDRRKRLKAEHRRKGGGTGRRL